MKTIATILAIVLLTILSAPAQTKRPTIAVLSIESRDVNTEAIVVTNIIRTELEKLAEFNVMDKYDVQYFLQQNKVNMINCLGKTCLTEVGNLLKADKMFTGSVEREGRYIVCSYRIIDVHRGEIEKVYVHEFLNLPDELQNMVKLSIAEMFKQQYDQNLMNKLSKPFELDNANNNPEIERLRLDGPRMGMVVYTGDMYQRIMAPKKEGGFDAFPVMFQFGYQFEKQYLNEGKVQALVEFIPLITGLDQGYFIPSFAIMHGLRSNVNGWEFAFGPTFNLVPIASGYFDNNNKWQLARDWYNNPDNAGRELPYEVRDRLDTRGNYRIHSSFVFAAGRTFKSGRLNIPVNAFVVPGRSGWRCGISFGFNAKNRS
jgi:TolB-like protein